MSTARRAATAARRGRTGGDRRGRLRARAAPWAAVLAAALLAWGAGGVPACAGDGADGPVWFHAASDGRRVDLEWRDAPDREEAGFNVLRAIRPAGPYAPVNPWLIPAGTGDRGAYVFSDLAVEERAEYFYVLEAVDAGGARVRRGPLRVRVEAGAGEAWGERGPAEPARAATGGGCVAGPPGPGAPDPVLAALALLALGGGTLRPRCR